MNTLNLDIVTLMVQSTKEKMLNLLCYKPQQVKWYHEWTYSDSSRIKTGHIKVRFHNGSEYLAVSGGFVEVRQHKLSVIVQTAETAEEIDVERAKLAKQRAQSHLNDEDNSDIYRARAC